MGRDWLTGAGDQAELFRLLWDTGRKWGALATIDVDEMKLVNHERGHAAGDAALCDLVTRIGAALPEHSVICRSGSDEFAVLAETGELGLATALETVIAAAAAEQLAFSAGVVSLADQDDVERRLADAETAMFVAKRQGRRRVVVHGLSTERYVEERRELFARVTRLHEENLRLREEIATDALTGIGNRRALDQHVALAEGVERTTWAVLFLDVDQFHDYNHRHGDHAGDRALRAVARALASSLRASDMVASALAPEVFRKGGEEFVVIAPVGGCSDAVRLAERLRAVVEDLRIPHGAKGRPFVTVSVGVAVADDDTSVHDAVVVAAERAFWLKRHRRRNTVRATDDETGDEETGDDVAGDHSAGDDSAGDDVA